MGQGRDGVGDGLPGPVRSPSVKGLRWRGGAVAAMGALVWIIWSRRGPIVGVPETVGFAFPALRLAAGRRSSAWASRHRVLNQVGWWAFAGALWIWLGALLDPQTPPAALVGGAAVWVVVVTVSGWWENHRKARVARRKLLTALATDLQNVVASRHCRDVEGQL